METSYQFQSDSRKKITVETDIIYALWTQGAARAGGQAGFEVRTALAGEGAPIEITAKSRKGKKLVKIKDTLSRNRYTGVLDIPEKTDSDDEIFFEARLPKHGVSMDSNRIPVRPKIFINSMQWSHQQVRRGDEVTLTLDIQSGIDDDTPALVIIYEYGPDGIHEPIVKIPTTINNRRLDLKWKFDYQWDTAQIPTQSELEPVNRTYRNADYFFVVVVDNERIGAGQESGLMRFTDWIELKYTSADGTPVEGIRYKVTCADGSVVEGQLDDNGTAKLDSVPPGGFQVEYLFD